MKTHVHHIRIGHWRFYVSNIRLKKMNPAAVKRSKQDFANLISAIKEHHYKHGGGRCAECGRKLRFADVCLHHVLPFALFPELGGRYWNLVCLCQRCHYIVHNNPLAQVAQMQRVAREHGIDLAAEFQQATAYRWKEWKAAMKKGGRP